MVFNRLFCTNNAISTINRTILLRARNRHKIKGKSAMKRNENT